MSTFLSAFHVPESRVAMLASPPNRFGECARAWLCGEPGVSNRPGVSSCPSLFLYHAGTSRTVRVKTPHMLSLSRHPDRRRFFRLSRRSRARVGRPHIQHFGGRSTGANFQKKFRGLNQESTKVLVCRGPRGGGSLIFILEFFNGPSLQKAITKPISGKISKLSWVPASVTVNKSTVYKPAKSDPTLE